MKYYKIIVQYIFGFIFILSSFSLSAQKQFLKAADKYYHQGVYTEAAKMYSVLMQEKYDTELNLKIADCYQRLNLSRDAEYWYAVYLENNPHTEETLLQYAELLKANGKYTSAKQIYLEYALKNEDGYYLAGTCDFAVFHAQDENSYLIDTVSFNTSGSDIAPVFYGNGLLVSSAIPTPADKDGISGFRFYDIYFISEPNSENSSAVLFNSQVNSDLHDVASYYDSKLDQLYFSRNNFLKNREIKSKDNQVKVQLYKADYNGGKWKPISSLPFNSKNYSIAQASLSDDGNILFFVSDMPGGFGGMDIYYATRINNIWSEPKNIGANINTSGNEMFPYLDGGNFYFSSDRLPGFGGFDIFTSVRNEYAWSEPVNMGKPLNSSADDFGFITHNGEGFFSSNRVGGKGYDDIYACTFLKPISKLFITDEKGIPLNAAHIKLIEDNRFGEAGDTDVNGFLSIEINDSKNTVLQISRQGFQEMQITDVESLRSNNGILPIKMTGLMGEQEHRPEEIKQVPVFEENQNNNIETIEETHQQTLSTEQVAPEEKSIKDADAFTYEVQLGVFKNPDYGKIFSLNSYGEINSKTKDDGSLSFSIINLETITEAENAKSAAVKAGFSDAYIIIYKNGEKQN